MRARSLVATTMTWMLASCAASAARGGAARAVLTQEQLAATNSQNVYEAVEKLRPEWLTSRGPTSVTDPTPTVASVYTGGTMLGKADYLREMRILDVTEVRYWNAGQASARFGMGHPRGVIEIVRR